MADTKKKVGSNGLEGQDVRDLLEAELGNGRALLGEETEETKETGQTQGTRDTRDPGESWDRALSIQSRLLDSEGRIEALSRWRTRLVVLCVLSILASLHVGNEARVWPWQEAPWQEAPWQEAPWPDVSWPEEPWPEEPWPHDGWTEDSTWTSDRAGHSDATGTRGGAAAMRRLPARTARTVPGPGAPDPGVLREDGVREDGSNGNARWRH